MKNVFKYALALLAVAVSGLLTGCGEYEPKGFEEVPDLPTVSNLKAEIQGHDINVSWTLPAGNVTGVQFIRNGRVSSPVMLPADATSYVIKGQPMGEEGMYTVKVCYDDKYVSRGVTAYATLPVEELAGVSSLKADVNRRTVTLTWALPTSTAVTGVRVYRDGDVAGAVSLPADATSYVFKSQPMEQELTYTVEAMYDTYYPSVAASSTITLPYVPTQMGFLQLSGMTDDDEVAAANWFRSQPDATFVTPAQLLAGLDPEEISVLWIEIDRVGLPMGWTNLPEEVSSDAAIAALKAYSAAGGSLYLANMATQLTVPLGFVPQDWAPTVYGNGDGGTGDDVWVINPYLGWDFRNGADQGFYDRTEHAVFKGLTLEDPNGYGYQNLPLIGPGQREDHNCLWDCNIYGRGDYPDVIANFEAVTGSQVLATWGHVRDHCVAGLVDFYASPVHGRCIANGLAAYEWNQNSGANPYQKNIEGLTSNILNYLK
ncbi:MAG: DUF4960 domain-containing protein [Muribaculaceae bacterium]|nr:DUF4960 domain-containing protein [Muribaculaceae bacterium]